MAGAPRSTTCPHRPVPGGRAARRAGLLVLLLAVGCATLRPTPPGPGSVAPADCRSTVFVADGAGNFQIASNMLRKLARSSGAPVEVVTYEWSHGYGRMVADQLGYRYARDQGKGLAAAVVAYHAAHPDRPIHLLGHSAGSTVVMAALEELPPDLVERAVLLSPSLSACYEVRPALRHVKSGLYVFYSPYDYWYLGVITRLVGTADRRWTATSGRVGFAVDPADEETWLYRKLYQRAWQPEDRELGNNGGHYGNYQPAFMRLHVLPLFVSAE